MALLILLGVGRDDTSAVAASMAEKISNLSLEDWFVPVLFQEKDDPQLFRGAPPSKQTVEDFQAALATRLGELPLGSTGLFHLAIVYHPAQNGATYLRANNNNAAPQFSPSEASTDYLPRHRQTTRIKIDPITRLLRESNTRQSPFRRGRRNQHASRVRSSE